MTGVLAWLGLKWAAAKADPALWVILALVVIVLCGALTLKLIVRDEVRSASTAAVIADRNQSSVVVTTAVLSAERSADAKVDPEMTKMAAAIQQTHDELQPVIAKHGKDTVSPARQAYIDAMRRRAQGK